MNSSASSFGTRDFAGLAAISLCAFAAMLIVNQWVLRDFANSADEFAYQFQATLFSEGRYYADAHPLQTHFNPFYIIEHEDKVFSIFPPGWPLVLSLGVLSGNTSWVNPLLGALSIPLLFVFALHITSKPTAWIATLLYAISPFFIFNSASYFSHPSCSLFLLCCLYALLRVNSTHHTRRAFLWAAAGGLAFSIAFCIREFTAIVYMTFPFLYFITQSKQRTQFLLSFAAGAFPLFLWYGYYCCQVTGHWFYPTRFLLPHETLGFGLRTNQLFDYVETYYYGPLDALKNALRNLWLFQTWTVPGLFFLALYGIYLKRNGFQCLSIASAIPCIVLGYMLYSTQGGNQYGPRFYYETFPLYCFFAGIALHELVQRLGWIRISSIFALSLFLLVLLYANTIYHYSESIQQRRSLERLVERRNLKNAVVLIYSASGDMTQGDLIRNPPNLLTSDVIYAWDLGNRNKEVFAAFPERTFYAFGYDPSIPTYYLKQLPSPSLK